MMEIIVFIVGLVMAVCAAWLLIDLIIEATNACRAITQFLSGPAINITDNRKYYVSSEGGKA